MPRPFFLFSNPDTLWVGNVALQCELPGGVKRPGFTYQSSFGRHRTRRACSLLRL
jgi:hypothetical protein